jgi:outer membrane receptor for ferric coprogen and ferric-rhodotorulic acid
MSHPLAAPFRFALCPLSLALPAALLSFASTAHAAETADSKPAATDDGVLQLGATNISGQALGATTEDTHSYTTGTTSSATGLALSRRETPQSVTVVTRQQMDDRGVQSV